MNDKPLGKKCYGSIPHLSGSRLGEKDYKITEGQELILTKKARDWKDLIIVTEKLDGSNCSIAKIDGRIVALTRSGNLAYNSKYKQHHIFSIWVRKFSDYFSFLLNKNWRITGEWMLQAHGTKYKIDDKCMLFRPFDIFIENERINYLEMCSIINYCNGMFAMEINPPELLHIGQPISMKNVEKKLIEIEKNRIDKCEGAVWRVERDSNVDFLAKYVRQNKVDGIYMKDEIYNYTWR